jgi:ECF transporter S component (folate family)
MAEIYDTETSSRSKQELLIITIAISALVLALNISFGALPSFDAGGIFKLGIGFIPVMFSGMLLKPGYCVILAALGDVIKYFIFDSAYAFNPIYTVSAAIAGLIWSLAFTPLRNKGELTPAFIIRIVIASLLVVVICNIGLGTFGVMMDKGKAWEAVIIPRLGSNAFVFAYHIPFGIGLAALAVKIRKQFID